MATISAPDLVLLRTQQQHSVGYLSILQPTVLLTAAVTGAPTRGQRAISYNGGASSSFSTIEEGQTIIFSTAYGIFRGRLKAIAGVAANGTITLDENGFLLTNGDTITIYHNYEVHPIPPAIRSQVFYKFYDTAYSNQNSLPNPVAIAGPHKVGWINTVTPTSVVFSLNATPSYAIAQGATISSYAWTCIHNGGAATGIAFSNPAIANPTLTISEVGQYWLKLVVTDSNGKTQSTYRALWVYDRSGTLLPYLDFTIQSLGGDWQTGGWKCSLQATGDVDLTDFPDWTLVVVSYDNFFNGVEDYVNLWSSGDNIIIAGYLRQDTDNDDFSQGTGNVSFQISTIDDLLNNVCELGTVSLNAVTSPTKWYEYASWMIAGRSIHHLIRWQSWGVLETCDVLGLTDNTLGVKNTDYSESSLLQQVNVFAYQRGIFAKLISNRLGQMYLVADTQMLNTAQRAALDTIFTITTADISGTIDVVRSPEQTVVFAQLDGFKFNGTTSTPYVSIVPGYRESSVSYIIPNERGRSIVSVSNQVLDSQTDANEKIGRYVALANNNPRELRFSTPGNYLGCFDIIPSQGWYAWGISDVSLKRNTELNGKKFVCRNVSHSLDFQGGVIQTSVVLEKEAIGPDGIQGNYPTGYPTVSLPTPTWDTGGANTSLADFITSYPDGSPSAYYLKAGRYSGGTISLSAAAVQISANTGTFPVVLCGLASNKGLALYRHDGSSEVRARTVNVDNSLVVTLGGETTVLAGYYPSCIIALSSTKALAAINDGGSPAQSKVVVLSISGDTITVGTPVDFETNATGVWLTRLSSSLACSAYFFPDDVVRAASISISGSTPTINTPADITSSPIGGLAGTNIASLDNTTCIVLYLVNTELRAVSIYNISSSFTVGSDIQLVATNAYPAGGNGLPYITKLLNTELPYTWMNGAAPYSLRANSVTYSGSGNISDGSDTTFSSGVGNRLIPSIAAISNNRMIVVYYYINDAGSDAGVFARSLSYSGNIVDDNNEVAVDSSIGIAGGNTPSIAQLRIPS